jgi:uncharacterized protein (DUF697 family)
MADKENHEKGQKLLNAVERMIDDTENIIFEVDTIIQQNPQEEDQDDDQYRELIAQHIVSKYSSKSALAGGLTALPAIIPGGGTLLAALGGTLADMGLVLKFEVEMALSLSWLFGFDIRNEKERQIAFLIASVNTYEEKSGENFFVDLAKFEGQAIWKYTPREISKVLLTVMTQIALLTLSKGFIKLIPVVGVAVSGSVNKVLTTKVGNRCIKELTLRIETEYDDVDEAEDDVVQGKVKSL